MIHGGSELGSAERVIGQKVRYGVWVHVCFGNNEENAFADTTLVFRCIAI